MKIPRLDRLTRLGAPCDLRDLVERRAKDAPRGCGGRDDRGRAPPLRAASPPDQRRRRVRPRRIGVDGRRERRRQRALARRIRSEVSPRKPLRSPPESWARESMTATTASRRSVALSSASARSSCSRASDTIVRYVDRLLLRVRRAEGRSPRRGTACDRRASGCRRSGTRLPRSRSRRRAPAR